jgi:lipopolysaccharide/colanic/teichoic acid biosynthesis glycosyltransferase
MFQRLIALILFILTSPLWFIFFVLIKLDSKGSFIFKQKRMGKDKKIFTIYKFRTMVEDAEKLKQRYLKLNEATGPVFKINNDPRFTRFGKSLSYLGLDELPQLVNIFKGEMAFVGPRPLPVEEAKKVPKKYERRFSVLPGITSLWVIKGQHKLTFIRWMDSDLYYIEKRNALSDFVLILKTVKIIASLILIKIFKNDKLLVSIIVFFGVVIRLLFICTKNVSTDEVWYNLAARDNSIISILNLDYWIKNHGQLYISFLKILQIINATIITSRLVNILVYILIVIFGFKFFNKINRNYAVIFVLCFSFFAYFVYLNVYTSPYNFVLCFSFFAFISVSNLLFFAKNNKNTLKNSILFIVFSALAFYTDYSVIYFYLSLLVVALYLLIWKREKIKSYLFLCIINLITILPGVLILIKNFRSLYSLAPISPDDYAYVNWVAVSKFLQIIIFDFNDILALIIFTLIFIYLIINFVKTRKEILGYLSFLIIISFCLDFIFLYIFNNFYFFIFYERPFWYFYLLLILGISTLFINTVNKNLKIILFLLLLLFICYKFIQQAENPMFFVNIDYKNLVNQIISGREIGDLEEIVFVDINYMYIPVKDYYFKGYDIIGQKEAAVEAGYFKNIKVIVIKNPEDVAKLSEENISKRIFIICSNSSYRYNKLKQYVSVLEKQTNQKISNLYFRLGCKYNNCYFYRDI